MEKLGEFYSDSGIQISKARLAKTGSGDLGILSLTFVKHAFLQGNSLHSIWGMFELKSLSSRVVYLQLSVLKV